MDVWLRRIAVGGMMVAFLALCFSIVFDIVSPADEVAAAWAEVAVVMISMGIAIMAPEYHARRREAQERGRLAELLVAFSERATSFGTALLAVLENYPVSHAAALRHQDKLGHLHDSMKQISVRDMPNGSTLQLFLGLRESTFECYVSCGDLEQSIDASEETEVIVRLMIRIRRLLARSEALSASVQRLVLT